MHRLPRGPTDHKAWCSPTNRSLGPFCGCPVGIIGSAKGTAISFGLLSRDPKIHCGDSAVTTLSIHNNIFALRPDDVVIVKLSRYGVLCKLYAQGRRKQIESAWPGGHEFRQKCQNFFSLSPSLFCSDPQLKGALCTPGLAQSCADIFFVRKERGFIIFELSFRVRVIGNSMVYWTSSSGDSMSSYHNSKTRLLKF